MLNVALVLSQGIPFIHCGQEFYRSKGGLEIRTIRLILLMR